MGGDVEGVWDRGYVNEVKGTYVYVGAGRCMMEVLYK